jgi:dTDP-4-dehydrorhamnose reductase
MLKLGAERDELKIVSDQSGAPTWSRNIADATVSIISLSQHERRNKTFKSGLYNLTATGKTSWCGFATRIFEIASKLESAKTQIPRIIPITTADYPTPAKRPANSLLSGDAILKRFGIQMPNWDRALELCLRDRFEN